MHAPTSLRDWINERGAKIGWLAAKVPVSASALSRWLNGHVKPSLVYRNRLADVTGLEGLRDKEAWE